MAIIGWVARDWWLGQRDKRVSASVIIVFHMVNFGG